MGADAHPLGNGLGYHTLHRDRVTGVEPAGDACRADDFEQAGIVADLICAKALTHIGVEIDRVCHAPSSEPCCSVSGNAMKVRFLSAGDRALVVEFGDRIDRALSNDVLRLDASLRSSALPGVVETVPTFRSLMVHYDPLVTSRAELKNAIVGRLDRQAKPCGSATLWRVPVCYEGEYAPDLVEVARLTGLTPGDVAALHNGVRYHVYMLGFLPGFPYMGDLPPQLALPRRADPRVRVPAGSVSIATNLTAIYPYESPGGWHLIGTTPIRLFDPEGTPPALFAPGDAVQCEPVDPAAFASIKTAVDGGAYQIASEPLATSSSSLLGSARQSNPQPPERRMDARVKPGHDEKG